ncbi:hypothetical protein B5M42_021445 [Paenibacillus athensensis]|uniref:Cyclophilin-like domain-containing protein n=1 Tax=Paenibacillus athensensis TaxID=1967502 RepID=A0A4Y8PZY1_9BACL|nr:hypothetical protein [Paenibacillus athensensis]MCD1261370.1 hypothetical protein [Paenibacillus athensensis]
MKTFALSMMLFILLVPVWGCNSESMNTNISEKITMPKEIKVKFGDGNEFTLPDQATIEKVVGEIKSMSFEPIEIPDSVGQNFTLLLGNGIEYSSAGYLKVNKAYYKAQDKTIVVNLDNYLVALGKEQIPGLLGR